MSRPDDGEDMGLRDYVPPELQELDRELSAIRIEERPSFAPELEGELLREWRLRPFRARDTGRPWLRILLAASVAGVMITVSVPPARAAVLQMVSSVMQRMVPSLAPVPPERTPLPDTPPLEPTRAPPVQTGAHVVSTVPEPPATADPTGTETSVVPEVTITFPEVRFKRGAEALIAAYYPIALQRAGVGGSVKLMFWVDSLGVPENIEMREGSGYRSLNYAAMRAARELRFKPATRNGSPVGTWVQFQIHFVPRSGSGIMGLDPVGSEGVGGH